jgi:molybdenum cofactor cytidylyltransferase
LENEKVNSYRFAALILAAGRSTRMTVFKPLMVLDGLSLLARAIGLFRASGIDSVHVVSGHQAERVCAAAEAEGAHCVVNTGYDRGMLSSVQAGLSALPDVDAFFLMPVDVVLVRPSTISTLRERFRPGCICYPVFQGRRGHPPLIDAGFAGPIAAWQGDQRLDAVLSHWEERAVDVRVADEAIGLDVDTGDDCQLLVERHHSRHAPSRAECLYLLEEILAVDARIVSHGRAVAAAAVKLGDALNRAGCRLDLSLLESAGLVHDIARNQPDHARVGARMVADLGYPLVADIVASHMDIAIQSNALTEAEVVYLADKLVEGDRFVGVKDRFEARLVKYDLDPEALWHIRDRQRVVEAIVSKVEDVTGMKIGELVHPLG